MYLYESRLAFSLLLRRNASLLMSNLSQKELVTIGRSMLPADQRMPIYQARAADRALTIQMLMGKHISFEGIPGVGKTTLMHSTEAALIAAGAEVEAHEETPDTELLAEFFSDIKHNAFWFQMLKLSGRQNRALMHENSLRGGTRGDVIYLEDRDLPGDMAFALYGYLKGNMSEHQFRIYMAKATSMHFKVPFLVCYLTSPPSAVRANVITRGNMAEIENYTEQYCIDMDLCYRAAFEICGCPYFIVEWSEHIPGVAAPGPWGPHRGLVPAAKCFEVLEAGIAATYGSNIVRIDELRTDISDTARIVVSPGSGRSLRGSDPDDLVNETRRLLHMPPQSNK